MTDDIQNFIDADVAMAESLDEMIASMEEVRDQTRQRASVLARVRHSFKRGECPTCGREIRGPIREQLKSLFGGKTP